MRLLEIKPEKRITAKEALEHEYLNPLAKKKSQTMTNSEDSPLGTMSPNWKKLFFS